MGTKIPTIVHLEEQRLTRMALSAALYPYDIRYLEAEYFEKLQILIHPKIDIYLLASEFPEAEGKPRKVEYHEAVAHIRLYHPQGKIAVYSCLPHIEETAKLNGVVGISKEKVQIPQLAEIIALMVGPRP